MLKEIMIEIRVGLGPTLHEEFYKVSVGTENKVWLNNSSFVKNGSNNSKYNKLTLPH